MTKALILSALASLAFSTSSHSQVAQSGFEPREREFVNSCASCHGRDGKGAGFLTRVFRGVDPGDLTQLSANNGGNFPFERVFEVIDGRLEVAAHGERKMPVWGDRYMVESMGDFGPDSQNEQRVRARVLELSYYLQTIQEP